MIKIYKHLFYLIVINFMFLLFVNAQDSIQVKKKIKKLAITEEPRKLLLHKMDPDNFNFGVEIGGNFNLIGAQFGNYAGKSMPRISIFFTKPISKYYINGFMSLWDFAIEPVALNLVNSRENTIDNQYGGYYYDPSFALHLIPDRSSSDLRIMLGVRPSYLLYSYSEILENGEYRLSQSGVATNKNRAGDIDISGMLGLSVKFSKIGYFDLKYVHSFTNQNNVNYVHGRPSLIEFGIRLSAVQIGKVLFDLDAEIQKQVSILSKGTLLVMLPTPNQNEVNALQNAGKINEIKELFYQQELTNKMVVEKFTRDYKFSKILFFSDSSSYKIINKNFNKVFVDENMNNVLTPKTFDSTNFFIASFCEDVSEFANRFTYGLHVYDVKMQALPSPFNAIKNDMGLFPGGDIIAYMRKKKALFSIGEYERVIRKFNDRLVKKKMEILED
jgi:hypothetical protein